MPLAKLNPPLLEPPAFQHGPAFSHPGEGAATAAPSPARALQERLEASTGAGLMPGGERWSARSSAALILSASLGLWAAILVAASQTLHAIA